MLGDLPPYALRASVFRFPALAALTGRRPLGGERELALATFVCAHLAAGALPGESFSADTRVRRAAGARAWLAAIALPAPARASFLRLIETSGHDDLAATRQALRGVVDAASRVLDAPAKRELERLASLLVAPTP